jgi:hypothetical protein
MHAGVMLRETGSVLARIVDDWQENSQTLADLNEVFGHEADAGDDRKSMRELLQ